MSDKEKSGPREKAAPNTDTVSVPNGWPRRIIIAEGRNWTMYGRWLS